MGEILTEGSLRENVCQRFTLRPRPQAVGCAQSDPPQRVRVVGAAHPVPFPIFSHSLSLQATSIARTGHPPPSCFSSLVPLIPHPPSSTGFLASQVNFSTYIQAIHSIISLYVETMFRAGRYYSPVLVVSCSERVPFAPWCEIRAISKGQRDPLNGLHIRTCSMWAMLK